MEENNIPATEAVESDADARAHYEFAFHILPTVVEEEVPQVFGELKTLIDRAGGELTAEEAPQRFDLAYELVQSVEGRNRRYSQSYFGWVRFMLDRAKLAHLEEEIAHDTRLLRTMLVSLTKREAALPFKLFEKRLEVPQAAEPADGAATPVSDEELDRSIEEITTEKPA